MKLVSWNVNGIRACITKGFYNFFDKIDADIFCIQETKMQEGQANLYQANYYMFMSSAIKKGYSGTLVYSKDRPLAVSYGIDGKYNDEGRIITLEFATFYFVCCYVPNSQNELARLDYRMIFEDDMREYLNSLKNKKSVIYCGDLNVAHNPIDIKNPKANERNPGYSIEERRKFEQLLNTGFIDTFRYMYPDKIQYSWWSYKFNARENNAGWRIDYFLVSDDLKNKIKDAMILTDIEGSDHAPVILDINL